LSGVGSRANLAIREAQPGEIVGGALVVEVVFQALERPGGHQPLLMQLDLAIEIALGLGKRRASLCCLQSQLPVVELREQLTGFDAIAFLDEQPANLAADLGDHLGIGFRFQGGRAAVCGEHLAAHGRGDLHRDRGCRGLGVLCWSLVARDAVLCTGGHHRRRDQRERHDRDAKSGGCHARPLCCR
jgi:hypothetical protein